MVVLAIVSAAVAQTKPVQPIDVLLKNAQAQAKRENKNVFVAFHASWCGWCKRLDAMMERPELSSIFTLSFVKVPVTVLESGDAKVLENPGGEALLDKLGGKGAGLPFYAILDPSGKMIVNSSRNGKPDGNIGHPIEPAEIDHFMKMMVMGSKISRPQFKTLKDFLSSQKK